MRWRHGIKRKSKCTPQITSACLFLCKRKNVPLTTYNLIVRMYRIFWTIRRTYYSLIFSKMERAPYSPVRLRCGSGCALSPSSEQSLCCNKRYQRNCTYLNSLLLESKLLVSFLQSNYLLSSPLPVCFSSSPTLVPFTSAFFSSPYVRSACIGTCT